VTPGPVFPKYLTPDPKQKHGILPESPPALQIRSHLCRTASHCNLFQNWRTRTGSDWEIFVVLMWLFWNYQQFYLWSDFTGFRNVSVYFAIKCKNSVVDFFFNSNCIHLYSHITLTSSSNVNIVEWLVSMPAVRSFSGSALTISFGIACTEYTFEWSAFNALIQKV